MHYATKPGTRPISFHSLILCTLIGVSSAFAVSNAVSRASNNVPPFNRAQHAIGHKARDRPFFVSFV